MKIQQMVNVDIDNKIYLFKDGVINTDLVGDITGTGVSISESQIIFTLQSGWGAKLYTTKAINLSGFKKFCMEIAKGGSFFYPSLSPQNTSSASAVCRITSGINVSPSSAYPLIVELGINSTSNAYVYMDGYNANTIRINKIWLEKA